ncbi:MAG: hypothetical protein HY788_17075 [Deltaproteobacteria bacterium]|nr:hypothetical protein [Deltaproteobacteria bacterium]
MKSPRSYEKFTYWLTASEVERLSEVFSERKVRIKTAKSVVCTPLDILNKLSVVKPETWNDLCGRQGSWYRKSERAGLYLVVSNFDLSEFGYRLNTRIQPSRFKLPGTPAADELDQLVSSEAYRSAVPKEWSEVSEGERRRWLHWLGKVGVHEPFERLFLIHSANHANFMAPRLYLEEGGEIVPYSIAPSTHLCSCCLELYNVIGTEFTKKLVSPCVGAVTFARLEANRYLQAVQPE